MRSGPGKTHAELLHAEAIVIDGHSDVLMAVTDGKLRLGERYHLPDPNSWSPPPGWQPSAESKLYNFTPHTSVFQTMGQYDVPRFHEGGLTAEVMAIFIEHANLDRALARALQMVAALLQEYADNPTFVPITRVTQIREAKADGHVGGILAFEGFEPLGAELGLLDVFYALGLRLATLTHSRRNIFADGTQPGIYTAGLTPLGRAAVERMNSLGIVIDLAHLSPAGCQDVLERTGHPVVLSHMSPRWLFRADPAGDGSDRAARHVVEGIAKSGGVVGVIAYSQPTLDMVVDDIETLIGWTGPDHVALGTDFFGIEPTAPGFSGIQDLPNLTARMFDRGHSDETIRKLLGGNYMRIFEQVW
jgi:membrane dipeptidase